MTEHKPRKRAESLAVENVRRIADTLRSERNDALALAQEKRETASRYHALLVQARAVLEDISGTVNGAAKEKIDACLNAVVKELDDE